MSVYDRQAPLTANHSLPLVGDSLHLNKAAILKGVADSWYEHGNGLDIEINGSFLVTVVTVRRQWNMGDHILIGARSFKVEAQIGNAEAAYKAAFERAEKAIKALTVWDITKGHPGSCGI